MPRGAALIAVLPKFREAESKHHADNDEDSFKQPMGRLLAGCLAIIGVGGVPGFHRADSTRRRHLQFRWLAARSTPSGGSMTKPQTAVGDTVALRRFGWIGGVDEEEN